MTTLRRYRRAAWLVSKGTYLSRFCAIVTAAGLLAFSARGEEPRPDELAAARAWTQAKFEGVSDAQHPDYNVLPPFSFVYDGKPLAETLKSWQLKRETKQLDARRSCLELIYSAPTSGFEVRCEVTAYRDYPAVEWVLYLQNHGTNDSPIIENIQALDTSFTRAKSGEFIIHHSKGSRWSIDDFRPIDDVLGPKKSLEVKSEGWPSSFALPFFNVEWPGEGVIFGLGWTEGWQAEFDRDADRSLTARAGSIGTHFRLHPGERVRTPRILMLFWKGDRIHGHNVWRRLILDYYSPTPGGKLLEGPLCHANWGWWPTDEQLKRMNWWREHGLPMEVYWMDIGWERPPAGAEAKEHLADCVVDERKHPNGLKPISNAAHALGMKFLLWFGSGRLWPNPDRVKAAHPEWLSAEYPGTDSGNPKINQYLIDHFIQKFIDYGVDVFRPDAHSTPLPDSNPDRLGINQARSAEGFIAFWDALLKRFPDLYIDNCCAGGENIDLETIKRSIALWRSDFQVNQQFDPIGMQCQTWSLSLWVPLSAGVIGDPCPSARVTRQPDPYSMRSGFGPAMVMTWFGNEKQMPGSNFDYAQARRLLNEYVSLRDNFYGDYYPLTDYSLSAENWIAWQFNRPDAGKGMVQVFRRQNSPYEKARFCLHGLDPSASYKLVNTDGGDSELTTGKQLMESGFSVLITNQPGAVVITYQKTDQ
ncbi:MAG: alpha-galactosidase [Candidatus Omnitrophica bacterium]|nr:alpha-galactosidase [Candidatus Omnitrophota bacterium]